jgi:hypothetical protein
MLTIIGFAACPPKWGAARLSLLLAVLMLWLPLFIDWNVKGEDNTR